MRTITVTVRSVWGNTVAYPVDNTAKLFAELAGTKTLTPAALQIIKNLGFAIQQQHTPNIIDEVIK